MENEKKDFSNALQFAKTVGDLRKEEVIKKYMNGLPLPERQKLELELKLLELQVNEFNKITTRRWIDFGFTILGILIGGSITFFLQKDPKVEVINQVPSQEVRITYDTIHAVIPKNPLPKKNWN